MEPVLGNGVACEIGCWMEACVARTLIGNAGEMNGFLKPVTRLLANPVRFDGGCAACWTRAGRRGSIAHAVARLLASRRAHAMH